MPEYQAAIDAILSGRGLGPRFRVARKEFAVELPPAGIPPLFSAFVDVYLRRALALARRFELTADEAGLDRTIETIQQVLAEEPVMGLVQYAVLLFLTHHPEARTKIKIKPLEMRQPELVLPSSPLLRSVGAAAGGQLPPRAAAGAMPPDGLSFWREDPLINEHHEHWHLVYPTSLDPLPPIGAKGYPIGDRHGELFFYMHQQMLARYNAERLALGMKQVTPFATEPLTEAQFKAPIRQGYDPGPLKLWDGEKPYLFSARPAGAAISDLTLDESATKGANWPKVRPGAKLSRQSDFGNYLFDAATSGVYKLVSGATVTADNLGNTTEANVNAVDFANVAQPANHPLYGNFHNDGHIHFMLYNNVAPYGVMAATTTAIRDPVFFQWHKLVDNVYFTHQQTLPPYDFSKGPEVTIRKNASPGGKASSLDIMLSLESQLPASIDNQKFGSRPYNQKAAEAFGGAEWNTDYSNGTAYAQTREPIGTTDILFTEMKTRKINLEQDGDTPAQETVEYLSHDDFYYFIRLQNERETEQTVAVRIFLAPESEVADRRVWIEMDRFAARLKGLEQLVIFRPADQSSVVRKPALRPLDLTDEDGATREREAQAWCDCGWPYTVLLPRGTKEGMEFRLLVMCSSGDDLIMPDHPECCTSISYCGLQNLEYPDKTAMGYPFDRPFQKSIPETMHSLNNWASRTIRIACRSL
jgi:tyrosinase